MFLFRFQLFKYANDRNVASWKNFGPNRPQYTLDEYCLGMDKVGATAGMWDDLDCNRSRAFVCEYGGAPDISTKRMFYAVF